MLADAAVRVPLHALITVGVAVNVVSLFQFTVPVVADNAILGVYLFILMTEFGM